MTHSEKLLAFFPDAKFSPNHFFSILNSRNPSDERLKQLTTAFNETLVDGRSAEFCRLNRMFSDTFGRYELANYLIYFLFFASLGVFVPGFIQRSNSGLLPGLPLAAQIFLYVLAVVLGSVAGSVGISHLRFFCKDRASMCAEGEWKEIKSGTLHAIAGFMQKHSQRNGSSSVRTTEAREESASALYLR